MAADALTTPDARPTHELEVLRLGEQLRGSISDVLRDFGLATDLPSDYLGHLVGDRRALGALLPVFFGQRWPSRDLSGPDDNLFRLAALLRAYVVVDDALRDGDPSPWVGAKLRQAHNAFYEAGSRTLTQLLRDSDRASGLLRSARRDLEAAYRSLLAGTSLDYRLVKGRCSFLQVPFDAGLIPPQSLLASHMLFLLQVADDCADRADDLGRPDAANLLVSRCDPLSMAAALRDDDEVATGFAACSIDVVAKRLTGLTKPGEPVHLWASAIRQLVCGASDVLPQLSDVAFTGGEPRSYRHPSRLPANAVPMFRRVARSLQLAAPLSAEALHVSASMAAIRDWRGGQWASTSAS